MSLVAIFKGDYITAVEMGEKKPTLTIKEVKSVEMEDEKTKKMKPKPVIFFREIERGWVLCKTTAMCVDAMFAVDGKPLPHEQLVGKRVTLKSEVVSVGKEKKPAVRVVGSPDIQKPVKLTIKFPKKSAFTITLICTAKGAAQAQEEAPPPAEESPPLDLDGPAEEAAAS